jgi:hypothetical protein
MSLRERERETLAIVANNSRKARRKKKYKYKINIDDKGKYLHLSSWAASGQCIEATDKQTNKQKKWQNNK